MDSPRLQMTLDATFNQHHTVTGGNHGKRAAMQASQSLQAHLNANFKGEPHKQVDRTGKEGSLGPGVALSHCLRAPATETFSRYNLGRRVADTMAEWYLDHA